MTLIDYDLAKWRKGLEFQRTLGATFDEAWAFVVGSRYGNDDSVIGFIKRHWREAYNNSPSPLGRFGASEPEAHTFDRTPVSDRKPQGRCRSGIEGGCRKRAVRGRFGPMWCEGHGAELDRIAAGNVTTAYAA